MFKRLRSMLGSARVRCGAVVLGLMGVAGTASAAEGDLDTAAFDTALTKFTADVTALVAKMAPAIVTLASITLIIVAINWLVRKVRGAIGRG